jgi:tetratricopeptide (TPR) repeat protein
MRLAAALALLTSVALSPGCRAGGASVRETREAVRTYPYSDPDPVPIFTRSSLWGQGLRLYPYFFYNRFSRTAEDREWTVVRLENPYLRVAILPEVGGKVWGATDKASQRDFLYTNHVLKFREIGLRGPWTSGGIEFNFGIVGHSPSTASPVDYFVRGSADGSASCTVGTMDLPSRTRWSVTIKLPADKAYFETNGFWHNPTPFSQSYYYWSCAAIPVADDLRYIFPGRFHIGHDYAVSLEPWPVDRDGRDLSWYRNNDSPGSKSYFTVGEYEDFYGAWYEKADAGFGHWALYDDMPGRKIWIWDLSRQGEIWVDLLTDKDGQYTEPQAGRLLNQSDHGRLWPSVTDHWREIWFPYRGIGPMRKASPAGVLSIEESEKRINLGFFPLRPIDEDLVVASDGRDLFRARLRLSPEEAFKREIPLGEKPGATEVHLGGRLIYSSRPEERRLERPLRFGNPNEGTAEGLFLAGQRSENERLYHQALEKYLACLRGEPLHLRALSRTAELYARRGEYVRGLDFAAKALEVSMYDPEANYIYGTIARRLGRLPDAKESLGWAARAMGYRPAAYVQLAEICVLEKDFRLAREYAERALEANAHDSSALEVMSVAQRLLGDVNGAHETLARLLDFDPLDHLGRFERYLMERTDSRLREFKSMIRNELPHESYLEMALFYVRVGCINDAVSLLENAPSQAVICSWLAYLLKDTAREKSEAWLDKALALSPFLVFPFREESIPVFEWMGAARPDAWKPRYYLGLILWGKGRIDEARGLFDRCGEADFAPFFMARASLEKESSPARALADYRRACEIGGDNWRTWHALVTYLLQTGRAGEALSPSEKAAELFPGEVQVRADLARTLLALSRSEEAASTLEKIQSLPYEGASDIHSLYVEAHIGAALDRMSQSDWSGAVKHLEKSRLYPENLGTGAPFAPDVRQQDYLESLCQERTGDPAKAEALREAIRDYTIEHPEELGPGAYFGALILGASGDRARAAALLAKARKPDERVLETVRKFGH